MNIGIYGYGNLGKGVDLAASRNKDVHVAGIFSHRKNVVSQYGTKVFSSRNVDDFADKIDVLINCGGSSKDLPTSSPILASNFNLVDSFDNHKHVNEHFSEVHTAAAKSQHTALVSAGWDPGLFSLARLYGACILPQGQSYTFWGKGISQGHSDAIRRIDGVIDARQYTVPNDNILSDISNGNVPSVTPQQMHRRECFVVAKDDADKEKIESQIKNMPDYFADYDTKVTFISKEQLEKEHSSMPHGGKVIHIGKTSADNTQISSYNLKLDSNPEFTGAVLLAFAHAVFRLYNENSYGCKSVFDIPPSYLSSFDDNEIRRRFL